MEDHGRDPIAELDFLNVTDRQALRHLARELLSGNVVLFAGAGLSFNARRKDGAPSSIPGWPQLAEVLRKRFEKPMKWTDNVLSVADYYEVQFGRHDLIEAVSHAIRDDDHLPGRVHERIVALNFREIITTNYDTLIERSFEQQYVVPQVVTKGLDLVRRRQPPRIIKMNGCLKNNPSDLVITGNDFLAYSHQHPLIEIFVIKSFVESQVLFIGFSLDDPSFRAINDRVLRTLGENCPMAHALQFGISQEQRSHWQKRYISMIDLDTDPQCGLEPEERLFRVLDALVQVQRNAEGLGRQREAPRSPKKEVSDAQVAELWSSLGREVGLDDVRVENGALRKLGRRILRHAHPRGTAQGRPAGRRFVEYLESVLESSCSREVAEDDPVAELREAIQLLIDLVTRHSKGSRQGPGGSSQELLALLSLLSFELLLRCRDRTERRILSRHFTRCLAATGVGGLGLQSMELRSRYLALLGLFAPLPLLSRIAGTWIGPARETTLLDVPSGNGAGWTFQVTPREYRLPLLGLFAVLEENPGLLEQAADSLWSRQLDLDGDPMLAQRAARESAYRFRYLMQRAGTGLTSWTSGRLQVQRLERILSHLFLEDPGTVEGRSPLSGVRGRSWPQPTDVPSALRAVVHEIQRGWIFGSPNPRSFERLWSTVEALFRRAESPHSPSVQWSTLDAVPWELLLLLTPAIEGRSDADRERFSQTTQVLWENGLLDPVILIDLIRLRWGAAETAAVAGPAEVDLPGSPVQSEIRHRLAWLIRWLTESVQSEDTEAVALPARLVRDVLPVIRSWLPTADPEETQNLVRALACLRGYDGTATRRVIESWLQLDALRSRAVSLQLRALDPPSQNHAGGDGSPILSAREWRSLWDQAIRARGERGTRFSNDVLLWSIGWSDRFSVRDRGILAKDLSALIAREADTPSLEWLHLAAAVRERDSLRKQMDRQLGEDGRGLAGFVLRKLEEVERDAPDRWFSSRDSSLGDLAVFAPDVAEEDLPFLERALDLEDLNGGGREGAVRVLAALLASATLAEERLPALHERWLARIAEAIERGATGRGELSPLLPRLSPDHRQRLQSNLIACLERESGAQYVGHPGANRRLADVVGWIHRTLVAALRPDDGSDPLVLSDLEERMIEAVASPHPALADACVTAAGEAFRDLPAFAERNRSRLRRILLQVEERDTYRKTSRFARNLASLREAVGSPEAAA